MTRLLPAFLWLFVAVWLFLADAWLRIAWPGWPLDLVVAFSLFATFAARAAALPWLLCCAGIARAVCEGGTAPVHWLVLGLPIAVLFPLRRVAAPGWLLHALAAGLIAHLLPRLMALARRLSEVAPTPAAPPEWSESLWIMATAPVLAFVIGRLPPLWFFREDQR